MDHKAPGDTTVTATTAFVRQARLMARDLRGWWLVAIYMHVLCVGLPLSYALQSSKAVEGVILDADGGRLQGVVVHLVPPDRSAPLPNSKSAVTDSDGRFRIADVSPGRYRLVPRRAGFVYLRPENLRAPQPGPLVEVTDDTNQPRIELRIVRQSTIVGHLAEVSGRPAVGVSVRLLRRADDGSGRLSFAAVNVDPSFATTNDRGEYRFYGLQAGTYYIQLGRPFGSSPAFAYYPGMAEEEKALPITVRTGDEVQLGVMVLEPVNLTRVRLYFTDPNVSARAKTIFFGPSESTASAQRITIALGMGGSEEIVTSWSRGHYEMLVGVLSAGNRFFYSRVSLDVGSEQIERAISLTPGIRVTSRIVDEGGKVLAPDSLGCAFVPESLSDGWQGYPECGGQFSPGISMNTHTVIRSFSRHTRKKERPFKSKGVAKSSWTLPVSRNNVANKPCANRNRSRIPLWLGQKTSSLGLAFMKAFSTSVLTSSSLTVSSLWKVMVRSTELQRRFTQFFLSMTPSLPTRP
jgi:Carboxypeptidase regulatory-like domain